MEVILISLVFVSFTLMAVVMAIIVLGLFGGMASLVLETYFANQDRSCTCKDGPSEEDASGCYMCCGSRSATSTSPLSDSL